ncbi:unnamed protein product [Boreogadus saida]
MSGLERPGFSQIHSALSKSVRSPDGLGSSTLARSSQLKATHHGDVPAGGAAGAAPAGRRHRSAAAHEPRPANAGANKAARRRRGPRAPAGRRTLGSSMALAERPLPSFSAFNSVGEWLEAVDMGRYKDNFTAAGYCYLEAVARMTVQDVLSLGVTSLEHQKLILTSIQALRAQVIQMHGRGVQFCIRRSWPLSCWTRRRKQRRAERVPQILRIEVTRDDSKT